MGLSLRKRSGKILGGSRLIVEGQQMLTAKVFEPGFENKIGSLPNDHRESPTTTTTTTIPPTPTNTPTPSITPTLTPTITESQRAVTPTPTNTVSPTTTNTPTNTLTPTPTNTTTNTPTPTNTVTPTLTPIVEILIDPIITNDDEYINVGSDGYLKFVDPTPEPTVTPTNTPTLTETPIETPTNTPTTSTTPTLTETPTNTPTNTPTPTSSPIPVTGYGFNLVALPYNFPTSGNSIMNGAGGATSGTTDPNALATSGRGFYFNTIDSSSIDRTSYFSAFTGQSVTITLSQTGSTAIYSGDTNSFKQWVSGINTGFVFGTNIGVPPSGTPSGTAILIQSATTQWNYNIPVYVSVVINTPVSPTPTLTETPTNTPTPTPTITETPTNTPTPTITLTETPTNTPTPTPITGSIFNMYLFESGSDVVLSGTGTFNLTNLTYRQSGNFNGFVIPNTASLSAGSNLTTRPVDLYTGTTLTFPSNFGISGITNANVGSGDMVSVIKQGPTYYLVVPSGYISNTTLTTQSTFTGKTLSSLGATVGTYTYTWGSGSNTGTLVLNVGP